MPQTFVQGSFAEIAARISADPSSLAVLREAMTKVDRQKERGARLRTARDQRGWTRPQLLEKAGLGAKNFRSLENWEKGIFNTSDEKWEALADALGVSFHWLYNGDEILPPPADILKRLDRIDAQRKRFTQVERHLEEMLVELRVDVATLGVDLARDKAQQQKWRKRAHGLDSSVDHP